MDSLFSLHRLTEAVRNAGADIAPTYQEYVQLAFAIANDCGKEGQEDFLSLCSLSPKFNRQNAEKLFKNALNSGRNGVHLGTAFHLAQLCGVKTEQMETMGTVTPGSLTHTHDRAHAYNRCTQEKYTEEEEEEDSLSYKEEFTPGSDPLTSLPTLDKTRRWPRLLEQIISHASSDAQRDVMLLGSIVTLGSTMAWHVRCIYGGKVISPCMQMITLATPASGKGVLSLVRLLVEPYHDEILRKSDEAMTCYLREKAKYDALGKGRADVDAPVMPVKKMFLISGNNTGTGILQNLIDSDGVGLICESEADTVSSAIGSDYGHWSDAMRKAFDHDRITYNRRTDREYRETKKSYLSVLLSGTPSQLKPLIPSAENGLFSRQIFYYMPPIRKWKNQFYPKDANLEEVFTRMGMEWREQLKTLQMGGIYTLKLSDEQKEEFNRLFSRLFEHSDLINGSEMSGSIARLAVNLCRIMEVVAMLRILESEDMTRSPLLMPDPDIATDNLKDNIISRWEIRITPEDFSTVLSTANTLYRHATHALSLLPSTEVSHRGNVDRDALMICMNEQFTRAEWMQQAKEMGIKPKTAQTWLKRMKRNGLVESTEKRGVYHKPKPKEK